MDRDCVGEVWEVSVQRIHDLVRDGHITPAQGVLLLELREDIKRRRKPWWSKVLRFVGRVVFG